MIQNTLSQIDAWYNEASVGPERPKLLSKLALLELCGWLEVEMDRIVNSIQSRCLKDADWTRREIIDRTFGFKYNQHFRPMIASVIGEHLVRIIELEMANKHAGDIDRLISYTNSLWDTRCSFAHADIINNVKAQQKFDAPSWSINQFRIISKILSRFEAVALAIF